MHHLQPEKAATHLAARPHQVADGEGLLLRGIEVQEAQQQLAAAIGNPHQQLAPRSQLDVAGFDPALHLHQRAFAHAADGGENGLVLVAQRQVQRQIDVAQQPEFGHRLRRAGGLGLGCGLGAGGTAVPSAAATAGA